MKKRILALVLAIVSICPLMAACGHYSYSSYDDMIVLGDFSEIEISEGDIENGIYGVYHDYFSDEISANTVTSSTLTSGEVKYGDTVNIDYTGYTLSDGEAFEGGSTDGKGSDLEIGSNTFIEGFESGIIGHEVGESFPLYLTFPETYASEELAGQKVRFDVKINKIAKRYNYPDMSDEVINTQSGGEFTTVADFWADARKTTIENLVWSKFYQLCKVKKWPEKELEDYYYTRIDQYKSYAAMMGTDFDTYATYMGQSSGDDLRASIMTEAMQQCKQDLIILALVEKEEALQLSSKELKKAMKAIYNEAKEDGYEGSYRKYLKENDKVAVEIAAYTEKVKPFITSKIEPADIHGKNGIYGAKYQYYYVNGVKQFGWHDIDIDGDGTVDGAYYFEPTLEGRAYSNIAVKMKERNSENIKFLKFGEKGLFKGVASNEVVTAQLKSGDTPGLVYIVNDTPVTGIQNIDRTTKIQGTEQYIFGEDGYMLTGVVQLPETGFGVLNGKYYNLGSDGIFNYDTATSTDDFYGDACDNAIANGIIDKKAYTDGEMVKSKLYKDEASGSTYYFDADGKMATAEFVYIEDSTAGNGIRYFDNEGKMVAGTEDKNHEMEIDSIKYAVDKDGIVISAKLGDEEEHKNKVHTTGNGDVYYFDSNGEMVTHDIVTVKIGDEAEAQKHYFNEIGKLVKSTDAENLIKVTVGGVEYEIGTDGVATEVSAA